MRFDDRIYIDYSDNIRGFVKNWDRNPPCAVVGELLRRLLAVVPYVHELLNEVLLILSLPQRPNWTPFTRNPTYDSDTRWPPSSRTIAITADVRNDLFKVLLFVISTLVWLDKYSMDRNPELRRISLKVLAQGLVDHVCAAQEVSGTFGFFSSLVASTTTNDL